MLPDPTIRGTSEEAPATRRHGRAPEGPSLDAILPQHQARMVQTITIRRAPAEVFAALEALRASDMPLATLFAGPHPLGSPCPAAAKPAPADQSETASWLPVTRVDARRMTVALAACLQGTEFTFLRARGLDDLLSLSGPGSCTIGFELRLRPSRGGITRLIAEMRISAADAETERQLRWFWHLVGLSAHVAVRSLLGAIRQRAEGTGN